MILYNLIYIFFFIKNRKRRWILLYRIICIINVIKTFKIWFGLSLGCSNFSPNSTQIELGLKNPNLSPTWVTHSLLLELGNTNSRNTIELRNSCVSSKQINTTGLRNKCVRSREKHKRKGSTIVDLYQ